MRANLALMKLSVAFLAKEVIVANNCAIWRGYKPRISWSTFYDAIILPVVILFPMSDENCEFREFSKRCRKQSFICVPWKHRNISNIICNFNYEILQRIHSTELAGILNRIRLKEYRNSRFTGIRDVFYFLHWLILESFQYFIIEMTTE